MEKTIPIAQYFIATFLALFIFINFGLVGVLVFGGLSLAIGIVIIMLGVLLSYLMFVFIRNVIIKSINEL